jgi:hypothetical protein
LFRNVTTVDARRIVDADIQTADKKLAARLASLQRIISQEALTDESLNGVLLELATHGHSALHVEVCRYVCERIRNSSPRLVEKFSTDMNEDANFRGPLHWALLFGRVNIARLLVKEFSGGNERVFTANGPRRWLGYYPTIVAQQQTIMNHRLYPAMNRHRLKQTMKLVNTPLNLFSPKMHLF